MCEIYFFKRENIYANHFAHEEFVSASSSVNADLDARACDILVAVKGNKFLHIDLVFF